MSKSNWRKETTRQGDTIYKRLIECGSMTDNILLCYQPHEDYLWFFDFWDEGRSFGLEIKSFAEADKFYEQLKNGDN